MKIVVEAIAEMKDIDKDGVLYIKAGAGLELYVNLPIGDVTIEIWSYWMNIFSDKFWAFQDMILRSF